jgi:hypothetical protein
MELYRDWDHDSGICAYEIGEGYIVVQFKKGRYKLYKYTNITAGSGHISQMQRLAKLGDGLNEYIVENKVKYESKR